MEEGKHIAIWNSCLGIIENIIEPRQFVTWFKPIVPLSFDGETLQVEVPSDFFREYLEDSFLDIIKKTLRRVIGPSAKLVYVVKPVRSASHMAFPASNGLTPVNHPVAVSSPHPSGNPSPFVYPGVKRVTIDPHLNPVYCFSNLIQGECNKMGIVAGESISSAPGKTPFNPLFIFGGPGLGKTHLAQAIGNEIHEKYPDLIVLYVTGNQFKTQYMDATAGNKLTDFLGFYQKIDVLIIDDIQDLVGQGSRNAFFSIFNHLHQNGKQLIFTSDRAPVELQNFEERLLSRFKWGLPVELTRPDYETRLSMLRSMCFREGVTISDKVLEYLATRIKTNFRELEGCLKSLIARAIYIKQEITVELAEHITKNIVSEEQSEITIEKVQHTVCEYFNITAEDLQSKSRKREIVQARQIAMYLCRNHIANISLSAIGAEIGGKDHATVLHSCNTVSDLMSTSRTFKQYVSDIEKLVLSR